MKVSVKGKQLDVGDSLRTHVNTKIEELISKYLDELQDAAVTFSKDAHLFCADVTVKSVKGIPLQSTASSSEPYNAFDIAVSKLEKRIRKHKSKLRSAHANQSDALMVGSFILYGDEKEDEETADNPTIVAEMTTPIRKLTVSEAVMQLDLEDLPALMFKNKSSDCLNMIYRRADGNIGWVDPSHNMAK
ncbi:MAG: ribosome-associated translation inhibitor RaiA [Alphaproteobacteria bacterium]|nr:ribosome-associated translation inhibitor RaiA [Alphaproteobacteria bacterium]MCL2505888.1 ribosome-associated translation inhibitor RaiA [Alphaproteobacteria bacterium]